MVPRRRGAQVLLRLLRHGCGEEGRCARHERHGPEDHRSPGRAPGGGVYSPQAQVRAGFLAMANGTLPFHLGESVRTLTRRKAGA